MALIIAQNQGIQKPTKTIRFQWVLVSRKETIMLASLMLSSLLSSLP